MSRAMSPESISILIVNWRSKDYLRRCLLSIRESRTNCADQIVVVDGGSFDGCGEMLAAEFPYVEFVQSPENVGFGRSNNLGAKRVAKPLLLLLNPDTEVKAGVLERMVAELLARPDAGMVGPRLLNTDGTLQRSSVMALPTPWNQALRSDFLMRYFPRSRLWGSGEAYSSAEPVAVEAVSGACMLLRTETYLRLGGFRPEYFMYAEDMDLCFRIHRLGLRIYHVPAAEILHHGGGSSNTQVSQFSTVKLRDATATYMLLNHDRLTALHYRLLQAFISFLKILGSLPVLPFAGGRRKEFARFSLTKSWHVFRWAIGGLI